MNETTGGVDGATGAHRIRLDNFLKFRGLTATGGQAKYRIQSGEVRVNGQVETRRGHHLVIGDTVELDGVTVRVEAGDFGPATGGASEEGGGS